MAILHVSGQPGKGVNSSCQVKIDREAGSARGLEGQTIEAGAQVEVVKVEVVKLLVKKS